MKSISIGLNALLIATGIYLIAIKGAHFRDTFFVFMLFAAPLTSLVALTRGGGESLIGLYFKRKTLEERRKIEVLDRK